MEEAVDEGQDLPPVQVCIRVRPLLGWEESEGHGCSALQLRAGKQGGVTLLPRDSEECPAASDDEGGGRRRQAGPRTFGFHAVLGPGSSQNDVWEQTRLGELVGKVIDGFHATVFAYGQTGSGKTHTMEGFTYSKVGGTGRPKARVKDTPPEQLGLVPRAVEDLFARVKGLQDDASAAGKADTETFSVKVSFLQIYKERIYDLLNPQGVPAVGASQNEDGASLKLRWDAVKQNFFVENLFEYECGSADDVLQHYATGALNKQVAMTSMNAQSSRSHTILMVTLIHRTSLGDMSSGGIDVLPFREVASNLALVDLAGSERAAATSGARDESARFKEAVNINQSLFVLRRVITALSKRLGGQDDGGHVPYRESKLTSLLQHAIGGKGFMLMLACLSPADKHYEENLSTLQYATQAALIKNDPVVNLDPKDRLIQQLRRQLEAAYGYIRQHLGVEELPPELLRLGPVPVSGGSGTSAVGALRRTRHRSRSAAPSGQGSAVADVTAEGGAWDGQEASTLAEASTCSARTPVRRGRSAAESSRRGFSEDAGRCMTGSQRSDSWQFRPPQMLQASPQPPGRLRETASGGSLRLSERQPSHPPPTAQQTPQATIRTALPPIPRTRGAARPPDVASMVARQPSFSVYGESNSTRYKDACRKTGRGRSAFTSAPRRDNSPRHLGSRSVSASALPLHEPAPTEVAPLATGEPRSAPSRIQAGPIFAHDSEPARVLAGGSTVEPDLEVRLREEAVRSLTSAVAHAEAFSATNTPAQQQDVDAQGAEIALRGDVEWLRGDVKALQCERAALVERNGRLTAQLEVFKGLIARSGINLQEVEAAMQQENAISHARDSTNEGS